MGTKFNWDDHPEQQAAAPAGKAAKFDWDSMPEQSAPADKDPGMFDGVAKSAIDSLPMLGGVVGGIVGTPADAVTGPMGTVVGAGIGGYLGTSAKNLINSYYDPQSAPKNLTEAFTQPAVGGAEQALIQGSGEAVAPYVGKALQVGANSAKWAGRKGLQFVGGASPDAIKEYSQFSDRINSAPNAEALKDISDQFVGKLADDVAAKKITAEQAQEAFKGFQSDLKDGYKTAGYDARDAVTSAQQTLKDAHGARIQQLSGDIYDSIGQLKKDVQEGSKQALKTLDKADGKVDLAPVYAQIDKSIEKMNQGGTDESLAVAKNLQDYKARITAKYGDKVFGPDAKRLIQALDQTTEYNHAAGSFDKVKNAEFKGVRSALDGSLKGSVDEYRAAMEPVAKNTDLLNRVSDFGDKQQAAGLLQRINAPNQMERRAALQELGQKYGTDFVSAAHPENLPEQALVNKAQAIQESLRPDRVAEKIDQTLASSRQKSASDAAQAAYAKSQQELAPFKPLAPNAAGQTTVQQKLEQLGKGKNIELTDMFEKLGKLTNTDFVQAMKDQNTLAAFKKGAANGSRNTLMGGLAGYAFGGVGGSAYGAAAGRAVDQWGPAMTKKVLDGVIRVSKSPTVATISQLEIPENIKRNMVIGLENYMSKTSQVEQSAIRNVASSGQQPDRSPARGPNSSAQPMNQIQKGWGKR